MRLKEGFTLIELLVVIAIIGLLSSVVLASLNSARGKAKDAAIKQNLSQISNLMALNYSDYGGYSQLQNGWANSVNDCNSQFSGTYGAQMKAICSSILPLVDPAIINKFHSGVDPATGKNNITDFSVMVALPYSGQYACVGSSGANSDKTPSVYIFWVGPGCYSNP